MQFVVVKMRSICYCGIHIDRCMTVIGFLHNVRHEGDESDNYTYLFKHELSRININFSACVYKCVALLNNNSCKYDNSC